jgi:hypothetical protein
MKFKVSQDVAAPLAMVWRHFTDFASFETEARARGATITRVGDWTEAAQGVGWNGQLRFRGKTHPTAAQITQLIAPRLCTIESRIGGMNCHSEMSFVPLSAGVTRVGLILNLSSGTLSARLLLQTLKLTRGRILHRLHAMIGAQGRPVEAAWQDSQKR